MGEQQQIENLIAYVQNKYSATFREAEKLGKEQSKKKQLFLDRLAKLSEKRNNRERELFNHKSVLKRQASRIKKLRKQGWSKVSLLREFLEVENPYMYQAEFEYRRKEILEDDTKKKNNRTIIIK